MRVSVIVPVRNEAEHIRGTIVGLSRQDLPTSEFEILVVDGHSDDGTAGVVRDLMATIRNLHLFDNPKQLASAARNVGVRNASGDFIIIVDGHCHIDDTGFLTNLIAAFATSGADTLGRPQPLRAEQPTPFQLAVAAARTSWLGHNPDSAIFSNEARFVPPDNVAVAYRREVFDRVGLFDDSFDACEDVEFNTRVRRAGLTCYFTPAIAVDYQPRRSLRGLAYQMARYGRGRARLGRKEPASVTLASLVPPGWLLWLAVMVMGSIAWQPLAIALAASLAAYTLVILAESNRVWRANRAIAYRRLPLVFATIHAGFGWGYLRETANRMPTWPLQLPGRVLRLAGRR